MARADGGYAALSGAAFTPTCSLPPSIGSGSRDMISLIEDWPAYWRVGDSGVLVTVLWRLPQAR